MEPLQISSSQWNYQATFHPTISRGVKEVQNLREAFLVVDSMVLDFHAEALSGLTSRFPTLVLDANEETKSLVGVERLVSWLIDERAVRSATIIAIGGGCVQDLVSFTAHLYYRGVNWIFFPTTVLSQADSCIGAKSGINFLPFKNQLGALHSPRQVIICAEFLSTLPDLEVASGYGEIVKLSVTSSFHFLDYLESSLNDGGLRNSNLLTLERASLAAKREIIEEDEYEQDIRRVLNYGHSFGHALEALSNHEIPHGLAVLWGIDVINALGVRWGITSVNLASRMSALTRDNFDYRLPITPTAEDLVDLLGRDKKVVNGKIYFAILQTEGNFIIQGHDLNEELTADVREILVESRVFSSN